MAAIDYETEYNNRARVPEHAEIFARWARDAEDYRAKAMMERRAELGLSYGESPRQFIDLFSPRPDVTSPLALFVHGGYWRSLDPSLFSHMARGINAHGVAVAVAGYDLCPEVTIAEIIEQIRHACLFLWLRTGQRMMIYGHSAGGHLSLITGMLPAGTGLDNQCYGEENLSVAAIINWYGIADVNDLIKGSNLKNYAVMWLGSQPNAEEIGRRPEDLVPHRLAPGVHGSEVYLTLRPAEW